MVLLIDLPFQFVGNKIGFGLDLIETLFCLFLSYPLSLLLRKIKTPKNRKIFCFAIGFFYLLFIHRIQSLWLIVPGVLCYYVIKHFKIHPAFILYGSIVYLVIFHLHDMIVHYLEYSMRINSAMMIPCICISSFAYNYYDGTRNKKATKFQKELSFTQYPSLFEYLAYLFNYNTILVGPPSNFKDFQKFINNTDFEEMKTQYNKKKTKSTTSTLIDNSVQVGFRTLLYAIIYLFSYLFLNTYFPLEDLIKEEFQKKPFLLKLFLIHISGIGQRLKYYHGMTMSQGSTIVSGYGLNGVDPETGKIKWDKNKNVDPYKCEIITTVFLAPKVWNIKVSNWLRDYIYNRIVIEVPIENADKNKDTHNKKTHVKKRSSLGTGVTFLVSAVWHGVYPGYYFTFILWFLMTISARVIRKNIRSFFITQEGKEIQPFKKIYDIICHLIAPCAIDVIGLPLIYMTKEKAWAFYRSLNYWPFYTVFPLLIMFNIPFFIKLSRKFRNVWLNFILKKNINNNISKKNK
ncbi:porcupine [Anaeramoeba flamelloides]|uniref:Porcupine n=1 Tax=Anaeramoeba flamelloides TaxID=1746091 RepID=A0AAV7YLP1_9EUKA|nr:porcupine [Anaeramoeba flamelloides]